MARPLALLLLAGVCAAAAPAWAANAYLDQARAKYRELDYQAMPVLLSEALLQRDISREEYIEIYRLQGFCYTVLGEQPKAREAFIRLLVVDPRHEMETSVSPRFRGVFGKIKKEFEQQGGVTVTHAPTQEPVSPSAGGVQVELAVKDVFARVDHVEAQVRAVLCGKEGAFVKVPMQTTGATGDERRFTARLPDPAATIPGDKPAGYYLEYNFSPRNRLDDVVDTAGLEASYKLTVGDAAAAAGPCKATTSSAPSEEGGGGVPLGGVLVGVGVVAAGGGGLLLLAALAAIGGGAIGGGIGAHCYLSASCTQSSPTTVGRVQVEVRRGGSSP